MDKRNLTMLVDFYEMTMGDGFLQNGYGNKVAVFDMFFRKCPDNSGYAIVSGLEQLIDYIKDLHFTDDDIEYLRSRGIFSEEYLKYLKDFKFTCDVWAVPEGTPVFPNEPIITVRGSIIQAQFIETMVLLSINHQSLITTKAVRIVSASQGRPVMEFGSRRAQGYDGAIYGARASYIGGCCGTACTLADREFNVKALGTMAHSWIQAFPTELDSFRAYAKQYPHACTLLVDTYNVLKSGVPNAITVFKELKAQGYSNFGIRIDSGDIAYLSKKARKMLDSEGLQEVKIVASNSLDEFIIKDLLEQGAKVDSFGVGERLITSKSEPVFGGVYKLVAIEEDGELCPKIKLSENATKVTTPAFKMVYRLFDNETGKAIADVITLHDETIDDSKPYTIFHPVQTYKKKTLTNFTAKPLLVPIFQNGECVYETPNIEEIKRYCSSQLELIWDEVKRFENPHEYYVDLSKSLWDVKQKLLNENF